MPIVKMGNRRRFVAFDPASLENPKLSFKAKGLLAYLLSRPPTWTVRVTHLQNVSTDGRDAVYTALGELVSLGYAEKDDGRRDDGTFAGTVYTIHETPVDPSLALDEENAADAGEQTITDLPLTDNPEAEVLPQIEPLTDYPDTDYPDTDEPDTDNPTLVKKEGSKDLFKEELKDLDHQEAADLIEPNFQKIRDDLPETSGRSEVAFGDRYDAIVFRTAWRRAVGYQWQSIGDTDKSNRLNHIIKFWTQNEILEALKTTARANRPGWRYFKAVLESIASGERPADNDEAISTMAGGADLDFMEDL